MIGWERLGGGVAGRMNGGSNRLIECWETNRGSGQRWMDRRKDERTGLVRVGARTSTRASFLVYQRILCFFPFFTFFISLTPAQYKAFFFFWKYRQNFLFPVQTATPTHFPFSFYRSLSISRQPLLHFQPNHSTVTLQLCFRTIQSLLWAPHLSLFLLALNWMRPLAPRQPRPGNPGAQSTRWSCRTAFRTSQPEQQSLH